MLNWSSISMWLTMCHNPQEGPWAPWSNIHYPSSTMAALGCPSQMKPSASSICTHFVHYSWAKNNPSLHPLPHAPQVPFNLFKFLLCLCLLKDMFASLDAMILSLCLHVLLCITFPNSGICVWSFTKQIPCVRPKSMWDWECVWLNVVCLSTS